MFPVLHDTRQDTVGGGGGGTRPPGGGGGGIQQDLATRLEQ